MPANKDDLLQAADNGFKNLDPRQMAALSLFTGLGVGAATGSSLAAVAAVTLLLVCKYAVDHPKDAPKDTPTKFEPQDQSAAANVATPEAIGIGPATDAANSMKNPFNLNLTRA